MSKGRGYLLPDGEVYTEDICPVVVCVPNKDEYFRALWGSLDYLGTWIAWERDASKRGKDAARAWKYANDQTRVGDRMGCMDDFLTELQEIKNILQNKKDCCDDNITYEEQPTETTGITPGEGDPPTHYGETPITTWDEWYDYVCYNANRYVDQLKTQAQNLDASSETASWTIAIIAAALAILSFTGIGLPISFALAATVLSGLAFASTALFEGVDDDIEAAREDIVCAIYTGTSLHDAVEAAIGDTTDAWLLMFQHVDYDSALAIIWEGGAAGEYLPAIADTSCDSCIPHPSDYLEIIEFNDVYKFGGTGFWQDPVDMGDGWYKAEVLVDREWTQGACQWRHTTIPINVYSGCIVEIKNNTCPHGNWTIGEEAPFVNNLIVDVSPNITTSMDGISIASWIPSHTNMQAWLNSLGYFTNYGLDDARPLELCTRTAFGTSPQAWSFWFRVWGKTTPGDIPPP